MCCNDTKNSLEVTEIARGQVNELVFSVYKDGVVGGLILCYYCFAGFKPFVSLVIIQVQSKWKMHIPREGRVGGSHNQFFVETMASLIL